MNIKKILIFSVAFIVGFCFYNMVSTIIELNHRVGVLEDQMETTMNLLTDDGMNVIRFKDQL